MSRLNAKDITEMKSRETIPNGYIELILNYNDTPYIFIPSAHAECLKTEIVYYCVRLSCVLTFDIHAVAAYKMHTGNPWKRFKRKDEVGEEYSIKRIFKKYMRKRNRRRKAEQETS